MADQTISFGTNCYSINVDNVDKNPGSTFEIDVPANCRIDWVDDYAKNTLHDKHSGNTPGTLTWGIPSSMTPGTYYYNVQGKSGTPPSWDDLPECGPPDKPSMTVK
jgi:hypothetical protein